MAIEASASIILLLISYVGALQLEFDPGTQPYHQTGSLFNNTGWIVGTKDPSERYLTYGPYTKEWNTTAPSRVDFYLGVDNNIDDPLTLLTVEVNDADTDHIITSRNISRLDFGYNNTRPQIFSLYFSSTIGHRLEFRVFYHCCSEIIHYKTIVNVLDGGGLADMFAGQAGLELVSSSVFSDSSW